MAKYYFFNVVFSQGYIMSIFTEKTLGSCLEILVEKWMSCGLLIVAHSSHHCPSATQWIVIKYATYASVIHFLHNFEAQLNTFLCAEGLYCIQYGLITRAEGLGVGEGRGSEGREAPHKDIVLNITKYLKRHIVLLQPSISRVPVQSHDFIQGDLFLGKIRPCAGRKLSENLMKNTAAMQSC